MHNQHPVVVHLLLTTGLTTGSTFVYTIQRVVHTRYNRLSNQLDKRLYRVYKHSTGCLTGCMQPDCLLFNRFDNQLNVCLHDAAGCSTG